MQPTGDTLSQFVYVPPFRNADHLHYNDANNNRFVGEDSHMTRPIEFHARR